MTTSDSARLSARAKSVCLSYPRAKWEACELMVCVRAGEGGGLLCGLAICHPVAEGQSYSAMET